MPDFVYSIFKNSTLFVKNQPENLIIREDVLLDFENQKQKISIINPLLVFLIISFIGLFITVNDFKKNKRTKIIGALLVFLSYFTDHSTAPSNYNLLWGFAPNLIIAFIMLKNKLKKWLKLYFVFVLILLINIPILWVVEVQLFPVAVIPFLILLFTRYLFLSKVLK